MISKAEQAAVSARSREACAFLDTLREGERVMVTTDGRSYVMAVRGESRRSDGAFGSWESTRVTVSIRPGGYSCALIADAIGNGRQAARRLTADEITALSEDAERDFWRDFYPLGATS